MPPLADASVPCKNTIDVKANGEASRMRSHKGNMPSLPQTKYCALCPAKFTRTTHLNRHLRSHTNERAHRCNICSAEFTRSDLLTRHKRTCGDSSNVNRSRRKSCQACAESKVKCSLQQPCSKCSTRGRECVFINDPAASRNRKLAKKAAHPTHSSSPNQADSPESPTSLPSLGPSSPSSTFSIPTQVPDNHPHLGSYRVHGQSHSGSSHSLASTSATSDCSSSVCSSQSSPRLEFFEQPQSSNPFSTGFNSSILGSDNNDLFSNVAGPFLDDGFSPRLPPTHTEADLPTWFETTHPGSAYGNNEPSLYNCPPNDQNFVNSLANLSRNSASSGKSSFSRHHFSTTLQNTAPLTSSSAPRIPTPEDLNHYLYLFFAEYSIQLPLLHRPTWKIEMTHPLLILSMQACGALLVKAQAAMDFIIKTLTLSRDILIVEFSKPACSLKDRMDLVLAVVLLQSIIFFQPRPEQRTLSKSYHEILVMMIRQIGLINLVGSWTPPDLRSPQVIEGAWNDWARYETFKRALALAFLQDCSSCIYYSASPSFSRSELDINLPCDDALWKAQSSREWYQMLNLFSPYASGKARMLGVGMQTALVTLREPVSSAIPFTVNPFSAFILVHSILRDVFSFSAENHRNPDGNSLAIQCALHNWQQMWGSSPEAAHICQQGQDSPFVYNAIPFYWLARFANGERQNGEHINSRGNQLLKVDAENRYRIVKAWLSQINATLQNGSDVSPNLGSNPTGALGLAAFSHGS
ncbi:hypothetical protein HYPSUDRAFT_142671 [Hypholoma sublateritium FD-334 SS-4]|uniref:Zn(2)-C6 fungal-type domain-containing protein n=1 Tax=Hypholoma sublateritium (strain FD-334 SS-4) TaxID=945553 RepID=A0A0D2L0F8_HYPSF|nr:hypothetical protein HYPSUDRAFT_142671 [Hypholoma sublateritium FD-334 SS-4]